MAEVLLQESILNSVKKINHLSSDYPAFDDDITMFINSILPILWQVGIGVKGFRVTSKDDTWEDFLGDSAFETQGMVTSYVALRVRLVFDPPQSSALYAAIKEETKELEWRLNVQVDPGEEL